MKQSPKIVIAVCMFSVAMAALESAVVVYLRTLYYPDGFTVAMKMINPHILGIEIVREMATIVMLAAIGYLAGKNRNQRFAYFLISFAVWDIFYYVWLKIFIGWPASWFEWDILFLLPITWLGPVLAPVICSATMIVLGIVIIKSTATRIFDVANLILLGMGSLLILVTFMKDYATLLLTNDLLADYVSLLQNQRFVRIASTYIPTVYHWNVFCVGEFLIGVVVVRIYRHSSSGVAPR